MKRCPKCNTEFDSYSKWGEKKFCSRTCANSRLISSDHKKAVSEKLKGRKGHSNNKGLVLVPRITKKCLECGNEFTIRMTETKKYCSADCSSKNSGGYRENSGRAKTGYYKGIYCGSTYELVWVIYNLDNGIDFSRFEGCVKSGEVTYYPDFLQDNTIIEIKGYEAEESVRRKSMAAIENKYIVTVLRKEDLHVQFEWVKNNYNYTNIFELYDGHIPEFNLTCGHCNTIFKRNKKPKTSLVFCSRTCAGLYKK